MLCEISLFILAVYLTTTWHLSRSRFQWTWSVGSSTPFNAGKKQEQIVLGAHATKCRARHRPSVKDSQNFLEYSLCTRHSVSNWAKKTYMSWVFSCNKRFRKLSGVPESLGPGQLVKERCTVLTRGHMLALPLPITWLWSSLTLPSCLLCILWRYLVCTCA